VKADARILEQMKPPPNTPKLVFKDILRQPRVQSHLLAFYTSLATLKIDEKSSEVWATRKNGQQPLRYNVRDSGGEFLFEVYLDAQWRENRSEKHEFIVVGLGVSELTLMLVEQDDRVYRRANCKLCKLDVAKWMDQQPVQKLITLG
jgi:hypothetical protein